MLEQIKELVIRKTGANIELDTKANKVHEYRSMYYNLCRKFTEYSYQKIGESLTLRKNHATVYKSCGMLDVYLIDSERNRELYSEMKDIINSYIDNECVDFEHAEEYVGVDMELYNSLLQTIYKVPVDHIGTVKERLEAIIKCLPKNQSYGKDNKRII